MQPETTLDVSPLREAIDGDVYTPGDEGWDAARAAWNLAIDQRPEVVVRPLSAQDVSAAVRFAADAGLWIATQGTGHNAAPYGDLAGAMLISTVRMRDVEVDPERRVARVAAGAQWGDVVTAAAQYGLIALSGSSHDVGAVGYCLGGGVSWLARKYGLASENVVAIEVVGADGEVRRATADSEEDLFWALRGGGGNFGVVTAMEIQLHEEREIYAGALFFPFERSGEVLRAWRAWTQDVPDEATSIGRMIQLPPLEIIPEPLRGNSFAVIEVTYLGTQENGDELLAPLRELGPAMDTFAMVGAEALLALHMDPPEPVPGHGQGGMLASLTDEAIDAIVAAIGPGSGSPLVSFEFRHLGGALARRGTGALGALDGAFLTYGAGIVMGPESIEPIERALAAAAEALAPVTGGRPYLNFVEERTDVSSMFEPDAWERLRAIKQQVDPDGLFRGNHRVS